jgi:hypothetical protein
MITGQKKDSEIKDDRESRIPADPFAFECRKKKSSL